MLIRYLQFQEKRLNGGITFIIKVRIKSLSNVSYLFIALCRMKLLIKYEQWRIQRLSDADIPVWAPKLGSQIKRELMQNNISHLIISSTRICAHVLRHLSKTLKNVALKTLCMPGSATQVCLNVSQCIVCINESNISVAPVRPN